MESKMSERSPEAVNKIISFGKDPDVPNGAQAAPPPKDSPYARQREVHRESDMVERSGQAIVALLQQASYSANANCDRAQEYAHKASIQLRAAEDRIKELEVDLRHYQDRAQRAEECAQRAESWLARIYKDVEKRFFDSKAAPSKQSQR
jgi:hypothetical protein